MFDDLFGFVGDFFSGVGDLVGDVADTVSSAFESVPTSLDALTSGLSDLTGYGASETMSASTPGTSLADEGVGSASADGGFAAPAAAAAREASSVAPDAMQMALSGDQNSFDDGSMSAVLNRSTAPQSKGIINSVTDWIKENPTAARMAGEAVKAGFSPDQIKLARAKAQAEAEAKMQLAQWLKDNNRAGGVGVSLNMRPVAVPGSVTRIGGAPVYSQPPGLVQPYLKG